MPRLRFVTDECIDVAVANELTKRGHDAWSVAQAGLADDEVPDDDIGVYAHDKGAVLVTDDQRYARRRRHQLYGQLVCLRGPKSSHAGLVAQHIQMIVDMLASGREVVVDVSVHGAWISAPAWLATPRPRVPKPPRLPRL